MPEQLPELPEGYFWRITEIALFHQPIIQIRKKVWFWSEEVMETRIDPREDLSWEESTVWNARWLLRKFDKATAYERFMVKVEGDYPPKSSADW